ncbi:hypothetical protein [Bacillus sp. X1(2014)]|uniref:hypothetical protein n=1 Tax=Bacillus sp. X1(2014) TaxID=1565991 RepID=UPI001C930963|nr:hypothetical protein [Bacillus sp. X1(2014)]
MPFLLQSCWRLVIIGLMMTISSTILQSYGHHGLDDDYIFYHIAGLWSSWAA